MSQSPYRTCYLNFIANHPPFVPPDSIEEEEALINSWVSERHCNWKDIAPFCNEIYGIPLFLELPGNLQSPPEIWKPPDREISCACLKFSANHIEWLIIKHPFDLKYIDPFLGQNRQAALARPSSFQEWKNLASVPPPLNAEEEQHAYNSIDAVYPSKFLDRFLGDCRLLDPSDWHLEPLEDKFHSRLRIDGKLLPPQSISRAEGVQLINALKTEAKIPTDRSGFPFDGECTVLKCSPDSFRIRISIIPTLHGEAVVCRFLPSPSSPEPTLHSLGMPKNIASAWKNSLQSRSGLWLVSGPTGSGKSTTLHATIAYCRERKEKIVSAEDPVERVIPGISQVSISTERGITFATALKAFLRQAPDSIFVGEIRDAETAKVSMQASFSGHRIFSTFHASSPASAWRRLVDLGIEEAAIPIIVKPFLSQRLIRRLCPACKQPYSTPRQWVNLFPDRSLPTRLFREKGCSECFFTGFTGRFPLFSLCRLDSENKENPLLTQALNACICGQTSVKEIIPFLPEPHSLDVSSAKLEI